LEKYANIVFDTPLKYAIISFCKPVFDVLFYITVSILQSKKADQRKSWRKSDFAALYGDALTQMHKNKKGAA